MSTTAGAEASLEDLAQVAVLELGRLGVRTALTLFQLDGFRVSLRVEILPIDTATNRTVEVILPLVVRVMYGPSGAGALVRSRPDDVVHNVREQVDRLRELGVLW